MAIGRIPEPGTGIPESIVDAKGDIVTATAADTPARLAVGTNEQRLVADSGETTGLKYVADTTNYAVAAKGDLLVGTAADTVAVLSVGTDGYTLVADSTVSPTGLKWAAPAGGGKVLQVVNGTRLTSTSTTSTSYVDTNLTATITPSSATSKILVFVSQTGLLKDAGNSGNGIAIRLMRDSTEILILEAYAGFNQVSEYQNVAGTSCTYLDDPATTSAITYKTQFKSITGHTVITQYDNGDSTITLMEIGA